MAKLYAEITSDKGGRVVSKSGDDTIRVFLKTKNRAVAIVYLTNDKIIVKDAWYNRKLETTY